MIAPRQAKPGWSQTLPTKSEAEAVKISLQDCLACSGCVTSAETVLLEHQSIGRPENHSPRSGCHKSHRVFLLDTFQFPTLPLSILPPSDIFVFTTEQNMTYMQNNCFVYVRVQEGQREGRKEKGERASEQHSLI